MKPTKLYIAYGGNLDKASMRRRCPDAKSLGKFMLTNAKLVFRGVADLEFCPGSEVPCALYEISARDEQELDRFEGIAGGFYFKSEDILLLWKGARRPALIYLMTSPGIMPPSKVYADRIRKGYRDHGLDERFLDAAIEHSWEHKNPSHREIERRGRQKNGGQHELARGAMPMSVAMAKLDAMAELPQKPKPKKGKSKDREEGLAKQREQWRKLAQERWWEEQKQKLVTPGNAAWRKAMIEYGD